MNYFIADLHFCNENCIIYDNRPFNNLEEMNKSMIDNWNKQIKDSINDNIFVIGDFIMSKYINDYKNIISRLKGNIYLIEGNHDFKKYCSNEICLNKIKEINTFLK